MVRRGSPRCARAAVCESSGQWVCGGEWGEREGRGRGVGRGLLLSLLIVAASSPASRPSRACGPVRGRLRSRAALTRAAGATVVREQGAEGLWGGLGVEGERGLLLSLLIVAASSPASRPSRACGPVRGRFRSRAALTRAAGATGGGVAFASERRSHHAEDSTFSCSSSSSGCGFARAVGSGWVTGIGVREAGGRTRACAQLPQRSCVLACLKAKPGFARCAVAALPRSLDPGCGRNGGS